LVQRYNTFQQYWQRVVREIENGTYRRHVLRAERTVGPSELLTVAARRRFGKERARRPEDAEDTRPLSSPPERASISSAPAEPARVPSTPAPAERASIPSTPAEQPPALSNTQPLPVVEEEPTRRAAFQRPAKPAPPAQSLESLELDMDFMGDWDPGAL